MPQGKTKRLPLLKHRLRKCVERMSRTRHVTRFPPQPHRPGLQRLLLAIYRLRTGSNRTGHCNQRDNVRQNHELVEHVLHLPNQVVGKQRTQETKNTARTENTGSAFLPNRYTEVDLGEQVPAQDGAESEEQQADGHKCIAEARAEHRTERVLSHVRLIQTSCGNKVVRLRVDGAVLNVHSRDNNQSGHGNHNERVNENADESNNTLLVRIANVGLRMRMSVEPIPASLENKPRLATLRHCRNNATHSTAEIRLGVKCALENQRKCYRNGVKTRVHRTIKPPTR